MVFAVAVPIALALYDLGVLLLSLPMKRHPSTGARCADLLGCHVLLVSDDVVQVSVVSAGAHPGGVVPSHPSPRLGAAVPAVVARELGSGDVFSGDVEGEIDARRVAAVNAHWSRHGSRPAQRM